MILAIGYRVRSHRGTQFRQWATERLNEYLVKGFTMDDERLKEVRNLGWDYFDELLERIRDIRASEKGFHLKITDIYATSVDYDKTAAELIASRADATKESMGLTSWKGDKVRKQDITVVIFRPPVSLNRTKKLNTRLKVAPPIWELLYN